MTLIEYEIARMESRISYLESQNELKHYEIKDNDIQIAGYREVIERLKK